MTCIAYTNASSLPGIQPALTCGDLRGSSRPFGFSFTEGGGFLYNLLDSPCASFRAAIVKDGQQLAAAPRWRHALPALEGARLARECYTQNGWKLVLCV